MVGLAVRREGVSWGWFERSLGALRTRLYARAVSLTHDRAGADDLVQETLVRALRARRRFQPGTNLAAWTQAIMRNVFIDTHRRAAVRVRWDPPDTALDDEDGFGPLDVLSSEDVEEVLPRLPAPYREIFALAYLENLSYRDIATKLGLPLNTTGTRLLRAKLRMRQLLCERFEERYVRSALTDVGSPASPRPTGRPPRR